MGTYNGTATVENGVEVPQTSTNTTTIDLASPLPGIDPKDPKAGS